QVDAPTSVAMASAAHVNSGTINIAGNTLTLPQTGTTPSFANSGTINISPTRFLIATGGAIDLTGGQVFGGQGTLQTNGVALTFQVPEARTRLQLITTTVTEPVTIAPTDSIVLVGGSPTMDLVNEGLLIAQSAVTLDGTLT